MFTNFMILDVKPNTWSLNPKTVAHISQICGNTSPTDQIVQLTLYQFLIHFEGERVPQELLEMVDDLFQHEEEPSCHILV